MNDEIKATLDWLKECGNNDYIFETGNSKMLLDYITNLQQENERLKEEVKFTEDYKDAYETIVLANKLLEEKYNDYKSRVEYVEKHKVEYIDKHFEENNVMVEFNEYTNPQELLNILQGENNKN